MIIIGKMRFVIEAKLPKSGAKNKTVPSDEGMVIVPDGEPEYEYLWFAGVGLDPHLLRKGVMRPVNVWTPYPDQAAKYKSREEAEIVNSRILGKDAGGSVLEYESESHWKEGRQVTVPVGSAIMGGTSNDGIDKTKLK